MSRAFATCCVCCDFDIRLGFSMKYILHSSVRINIDYRSHHQKTQKQKNKRWLMEANKHLETKSHMKFGDRFH